MNFSELARVLSKRYGFSKAFSCRNLKTILETIRKELKHGRMVRLRNFGAFQARKTYGKLRAKFDDSENFFR